MHVCLLDNKILKNELSQSVQTWYRKMTLGYPTEDMVWGQKVKAQGHQVAKHILSDRVPRVSLHSIK